MKCKYGDKQGNTGGWLTPSSDPSSNRVTSSSGPYSSFGGPKKSPEHRTRSNFPCFASIAFIFAKISCIEPAAEPMVKLETSQVVSMLVFV